MDNYESLYFELRAAVVKMRLLQKAYFKKRHVDNLVPAKRQEELVDNMCEQTLFDPKEQKVTGKIAIDTFRDLCKVKPHLMDINYREKLFSEVLWDEGYSCSLKDIDGDYQDWKGYANCEITKINND